MIFAKLDVCVWNHKRFVRAGPAACGFWMAALAYLRQDESSDGVLAEDVMGLLLGLGQREACKLAQRLVEVGLFERQGTGYVLLRYAPKNETRQEIEARRAATNKRVATFRLRNRASSHAVECNADGNAGNYGRVEPESGVCNVSGNAVSDDVGNCTGNAIVAGHVPGSDSDSGSFGSFLSPGERERESRPSLAPTPRLIDPKLTLDAVSREAAAIMGIQEIDVQWRRFVDKSIAKSELSTDFLALFRSRLSFIRNDEQRERRKSEAYGARQNGPSDPADPYNSDEARKAREKAATRRSDEDHRRRKSEAVPPPKLGDVLAALGSKAAGGDK